MPRTRQINFRLATDEEPLLKRLADEYGSVAAALTAGLHALDRSAGAGAGEPVERPHAGAWDDADNRFFSVALIAETFDRSPATVRKWLRDGMAEGRGEGRAQEVDLGSLRLPRKVAAEWLGIKSATLRKYTEQGRVKADGDALYLFGELEIPIAAALDRWEFGQRERAELDARARDTEHGKLVKILDGILLAGWYEDGDAAPQENLEPESERVVPKADHEHVEDDEEIERAERQEREHEQRRHERDDHDDDSGPGFLGGLLEGLSN